MTRHSAVAILDKAVAVLRQRLSAEDRRRGWTPEIQRIMIDWFAQMSQRLQAGQDLRGDYTKIARELDMSAISDGPLYDVCVGAQRQLRALLGDGE